MNETALKLTYEHKFWEKTSQLLALKCGTCLIFPEKLL